jgi:glycine cleavage system pyridoxal-binding protein P
MDLFENKEFLAALDELSKVSDVFVDHVNKKVRVDCRENYSPLTEEKVREEVEEILKRNKQRGGGLKDIRYETNDGGAVAVWSEKDGYIPENIARVVAEDQE